MCIRDSGCCDKLTSSWLPNCGDLFINEDYCGSYVQPCCETTALCSGEGISFSFTSDFSEVKPGWHIIMYVQLKDPYHMICGTHQECSVVSHLCLLYTSPSPRDRTRSRMPSSACTKTT